MTSSAPIGRLPRFARNDMSAAPGLMIFSVASVLCLPPSRPLRPGVSARNRFFVLFPLRPSASPAVKKAVVGSE